jgi:hypothetical protein
MMISFWECLGETLRLEESCHPAKTGGSVGSEKQKDSKIYLPKG